jgi:repressor LexA
MINVAESPGRPRSRHVPTERQRRILRFIEEYATVHGCAPSDRDIAKGAGLKAASSAHYHLQILKEAGYLSYTEGVPRSVRVLPSRWRGTQTGARTGPAPGRAGPKGKPRQSAGGSEKVVWVPVVGQVAAGEPIPPLESIQDRFPLPKEMVGAEDGLFILKVVHDSMIGVGIFPGDWVVVRQLYEPPKNGDIVAALLVGFEAEGTVKTYKKVDRRVWLMPQNPAYTPIPGDKATIHGKVVAVLRQV